MRGTWTAALAASTFSLVALFATADVARAADPPATDRLLPQDTLVYLTVPNVEAFKTRLGESPLGQLWEDPAMKDFRTQLDDKIEEVGEQFESHVGLPLFQVLSIPKGEFTLAVVKTDLNEIAFALIADVGEADSALDQVLQKIDESLEGRAARSTETIAGSEVEVFKFHDDGAAGPGGPRLLTHFVRDSFVVFSTSTDLVKSILDHWDGQSSDTLAENKIYQEIQRVCAEGSDDEPDIRIFVDPVSLLMSILSATPEAAMPAMIIGQNLSKLGLDHLKGFGGVSRLKSDEFNFLSRSMIFVEPPAEGLLKIFHLPPKSLVPPNWVGKDVDQYAASTWDPQGAYQAIGDLYAAFMGQAGGFDAAVDQLASHPANPGIHPKKDIIDQLTGTFYMLSSAKSGSESGLSTQMLFAIGVKDDVRMQSLVEKLATRIGALEKRSFEGTTIYEANLGNAGGDVSPGLAVSRGFLFVTTTIPMLEDVLRGGTTSADPLAKTDEYRAVTRSFPAQVSSMGFSKTSAQIEALWNQLRDGPLADQIEEIDLSLLPEFETVRKYFAPSGSYMVPIKNGVLSVQFSLPVE